VEFLDRGFCLIEDAGGCQLFRFPARLIQAESIGRTRPITIGLRGPTPPREHWSGTISEIIRPNSAAGPAK